MKKYIFMAVAAIAALSSCSSDNDPIMGETGKQALTFTASMEGAPQSRATYNSEHKCAAWEVNDQISINGKTYNAQSAGLTTTFKAATEGQEAEGETYNAYFACTYNGETATLPAEVSETWADGKFNMPMYATSTTTDLAFKNLCGVLKITVKSDQIAAVKNIRVSSANKAVSGAFTVSNDAAVLSDASTVANTLTITYTEAVPTTAEGNVFYVAIPAQIYQELKIELDPDDKGFTKSMTTKAGTDITVARNKIYPVTFANNAVPATKGSAAATGIGNVGWVQLWTDGPKFAEKNVGASSYTDVGSTMTFIEARKTGSDYVWGDNWCTPSKRQMDELLKAATSDGSEKVKCEIVREGNVETGKIIGFKFTGKETGYTGNSVFFPAQNIYGSISAGAGYWSSTIYQNEAWNMNLHCYSGEWHSSWEHYNRYDEDLVRPVLVN